MNHKLANIDQLPADAKVFIDTNVLLKHQDIYRLYGDDTSYSDVVTKLIEEQRLYLDIMVISEFINRMLRDCYANYLTKNSMYAKNFKYKEKYQQTSDFKQKYETIMNLVKNDILPSVNIISRNYDKPLINELVSCNKLNDFNDKHYYHLCIENDLYLLTDDADYKKYNPKNIISNNDKYFTRI